MTEHKTDEFWAEALRVIRITDPKIDGSSGKDTSLEAVDSLGKTELCVLVEEHFGVPTQYDEVKGLKTVGELDELVAKKLAARL